MADIAIDSRGNSYVVGKTWGDLDGNVNAGGGWTDAFLTKFGPDGARLWTVEWGTVAEDSANAVAIDSEGDIYVTGSTYRTFRGQVLDDDTEILLSKFSPNGETLWHRSFGSREESEMGVDIAIYRGDVYILSVSGFNSQVYLTDRDGARRAYVGYLEGWFFSLVTNGPHAVIVAGRDREHRATIVSLNGDFAPVWTFTWPGVQWLSDLAMDEESNLYVTGWASVQVGDNVHHGGRDLFIGKISRLGQQLWTKQLGTPEHDVGRALTILNDRVFVVGTTEGAMGPGENQGGEDLFLSILTSEGQQLSTDQWGSPEDDDLTGLASDSEQKLSGVGHTYGVLGESSGGQDAILVSWPL